MIDKLRKRLAGDEGFTLIELLVVIIIIGILMAIAVPSYLKFRDQANETAAQANVRSAVPAVESYFAQNGSYDSLDTAALQAIDAGVKATVISAAGNTYCITATVNGKTYYKNGPSGDITDVACT